MSFEERTNLKWKFMTEQVEIKLQVIGPTSTFPRSLYNILSLKRISDSISSQENFNDNDNDN